MAVEISGATLCRSDDLISGASLNYPHTGPVDGYVFDVCGWVVSKAPVAELEFVREGIVIACCELTVQRPDVAKTFGSPSRVGFWKAIGTVGLAPAFTIGVRVVLQDGRRREITEIRGTQQLTSVFTPSMQPMTVTSPGRSGSTLLIRIARGVRTREIFLVRDPRDTLVSVRAFENRRGRGEFAGRLVETDDQLVGMIRNSMLDLTRLWKGRSQFGTLVRYEDLILSPTEQVRAMLDALALESSPNIVDAMVKAGKETTANVNAHKTSPDAASSIGRWKRHLEPRIQKICDEAFGGLLDELGRSSC